MCFIGVVYKHIYIYLFKATTHYELTTCILTTHKIMTTYYKTKTGFEIMSSSLNNSSEVSSFDMLSVLTALCC
jgi:hypothetical protein